MNKVIYIKIFNAKTLESRKTETTQMYTRGMVKQTGILYNRMTTVVIQSGRWDYISRIIEEGTQKKCGTQKSMYNTNICILKMWGNVEREKSCIGFFSNKVFKKCKRSGDDHGMDLEPVVKLLLKRRRFWVKDWSFLSCDPELSCDKIL